MPDLKRMKMEERPENEPRFNIKNKTDRKIFLFVMISSFILIALIVLLFVLMYNFGSI